MRSACREWQSSLVPAGTLLSYGILGDNAAGAIAGVNGLNWSQANVGPPFRVGSGQGYSLTPSFAPTSGYSPVGYWVDPWGATPGSSTGPYNYDYEPITGLPGISINNGNAWHDYAQPGGAAYFTMPAQEGTIWEAQMGCWVYSFGSIAIGSAAATYAYRSRYQTGAGVSGFQATCEIWAKNSEGAWGWDDYATGLCAAVLGRNFALVGTFALEPGVWREVACPTATTGSGGRADGFLGLGVLEVWGVSGAAWQAAAGL